MLNLTLGRSDLSYGVILVMKTLLTGDSVADVLSTTTDQNCSRYQGKKVNINL